MEGTVSCDNRETRPPRAGAGVGALEGGLLVESVSVGVVMAVVAAVVEAVGAFFTGIDEAGAAAWVPAALVDGEAPAPAALTLLSAGGFGGAAGLAGLDAETFFAAGAACLATAVFLTAGLDTGVALATGFFTVTGSFDELVRAQGLYPRKHAENVRSSMPKVTHRPGKDGAWRPEQARDCIENSK
jgi:hypothetical protein